MQKKRQKSSDNSEMKQAKKSKRNKALSSGRRVQEATKVPGQTVKRKIRKKDKDVKDTVPQTTTGTKRKKQTRETDSTPLFEPESSLADVEDSEAMDYTEELSELMSDHEFLRQQIKILKKPFQLEKDCPSLSKIKGNGFTPQHLKISRHILHTVLCTLSKILLRGICLTIKNFCSWKSYPFFLMALIFGPAVILYREIMYWLTTYRYNLSFKLIRT